MDIGKMANVGAVLYFVAIATGCLIGLFSVESDGKQKADFATAIVALGFAVVAAYDFLKNKD